jgi:Mrp family chromosome partitioning ATPase
MSAPNPPASQFGDTAVRLGYVSSEQLQVGLDEQSVQRVAGRVPSPIGALLRDKGLLTPHQITAVLRHLTGGQLPLSEDGVRLAAQLKVLHAGAGNVIGVTGTLDEDVACATVEIAVGLAVMEQGQVLALDGNVRRPALHRLLQAPQGPGWLEHIGSASDGAAPLATRVPALSLLPAGGPVDDPIASVMSPGAGDLIERYRSQHRYVLVNLGPITLQPEAAVTASRCDGVIVVLRAGLSQKGELRDIERMLAGLKVRLSGVVLSRRATRAERARQP